MPGGDCNDVAMVPSPVTFVAPAPHRMLFPRSRARSQPRSAKDTTAQLDELLNQLSTKGLCLIIHSIKTIFFCEKYTYNEEVS